MQVLTVPLTKVQAVKYDLFISYADANRAWVEGYLLDALEQAGVSYHSEATFELGKVRILEFERAIAQSRRTLLVISPAYMADGFNKFVDLLAQYYGLETVTWSVIPLILEPVKLPPRLNSLVKLNATNPDEWEEATLRLCSDLQRSIPSELSKPPCPYPGMEPFTEANCDRFFGRTPEIEELIERLRLHPFISVIGPSGSGKSSLVLAGLIPALRRSQRFGCGEWLIHTIRPGEIPLRTLKTSLGLEPANSACLEIQPLETQSHSAPLEIQGLAKQLHTQRLLLVVDQFEEVFTLAKEEAIPFQQALLRLAETPNCYLILTVRADFYPDLMGSPLWKKIQSHRLEVAPLDEAGLREAIVKPAEHVDVLVESALVERLARDAAGEPGVLPLIQETLVLLWERLERRFLPLRAYEALVLPRQAYGAAKIDKTTGLQVAIARRADAALAVLSDEQQRYARRIFLRLVQFGEGRADTRRQQPVKALTAADDDGQLFEQTLLHLTNSRLLTLSAGEDNCSKQADIAHEALIIGWPTLQQWLNQRREAEQTRRRLERQAFNWVNLGQGSGGLLDEIELAQAQQWLDSPDATELGYDLCLHVLVEASNLAIAENKKLQQEARERELELITGRLRQERKARKAAQKATISLIALVGLAAFAVKGSIKTQLKAIEALSSSSPALFASHQELNALKTSVKAGKLLQKTFFPQEDTKMRVVTNLQQVAYHMREYNRLEGHRDDVLSVSFSPDGQKIATASMDNTIKLWKPNGQLLQTLTEHQKGVFSVSFTPDSKTLISVSLDNTIKLWQYQPDGNFTLLNSIEPQHKLYTFSLSPDGQTFATATQDKKIKFWGLDGKLLSTLPAPGVEVMATNFSPDGQKIVTASIDGIIQLWSLKERRLLQTIKESNKVYWVRFVDNQTLAVAGANGTVKLLNFEGKRLQTFLGHTNSVLFLDISPDGKTIVSSSMDKTLKIWNLEDGKLLQTFKGHDSTVTEIRFSSDGKIIASASEDNTVKIWNLDGMAVLKIFDGSTLSFSPKTQNIVSGCADGTLKLWQRDGKLLWTLPAHNQSVIKVSFSPDGKTIASASADKNVKLWSLDGTLLKTIIGHNKGVTDISFSPDGKTIASASLDQTVKLWHLDGTLLKTLRGHSHVVTSVSFSPDGKTIASSSQDKTVKLWHLNGKLVNTISGHNKGVMGVSFSPNGKLIASASSDHTIRLWRLNGKLLRVLKGHTSSIHRVKFSPSSKILASASLDGTVKLWSIDSEQSLKTLTRSSRSFSDLSFSPDGKMIAAAGASFRGGFSEQVLLWNLDLDDLLERGCNWLSEYLQNNNNHSQSTLCQQ